MQGGGPFGSAQGPASVSLWGSSRHCKGTPLGLGWRSPGGRERWLSEVEASVGGKVDPRKGTRYEEEPSILTEMRIISTPCQARKLFRSTLHQSLLFLPGPPLNLFLPLKSCIDTNESFIIHRSYRKTISGIISSCPVLMLKNSCIQIPGAAGIITAIRTLQNVHVSSHEKPPFNSSRKESNRSLFRAIEKVIRL